MKPLKLSKLIGTSGPPPLEQPKFNIKPGLFLGHSDSLIARKQPSDNTTNGQVSPESLSCLIRKPNEYLPFQVKSPKTMLEKQKAVLQNAKKSSDPDKTISIKTPSYRTKLSKPKKTK